MKTYVDLISQVLRKYSSEDRKILEQHFLLLQEKFEVIEYDREQFYSYLYEVTSRLLDYKTDSKILSGFFLSWFSRANSELVDQCSFELNSLLEAVFALEGYEYLGISSYRNHDILRKMFLAMVKDVRVVIVYLSKKLVQLQLVGQGENYNLADLMMHVYVPVSSRLGMYGMKRRLEDICFYHLEPEEYEHVSLAYRDRPELAESNLDVICDRVHQYLQSKGVSCRVTSRLKGYYSTYSKLKKKGIIQLERIQDLLAVRIVVPEELHCYHALSHLSSEYELVDGRLKDYIVAPKVNGYQSLHLTVLGLVPVNHDFPVEIQIRTEKMHREAEYGVASHWWYEEHGVHSDRHDKEAVQERLKWVKNLIDLHDVMQKDDVPFDFFSDSIFVLNEDNEVTELPIGSTPLDFAYHQSDEIGHHCEKVRVNGKEVGFDYELGSGDRVEVVLNPAEEPSVFWLSFLETELARSKVREWLDQKGDDRFLSLGWEKVNQELKRRSLPLLNSKLQRLRRFGSDFLTMKEREQVLIDVGKGDIALEEVLFVIDPVHFPRLSRGRKTRSSKKQEKEVVVAGGFGLNTKLSACCHPEDGDVIVGYVTRGGFISVHRGDCKVLKSLDERRVIEAGWR